MFEGRDGEHAGLLSLLLGDGPLPAASVVVECWGKPYRVHDVSMTVYPACFLLQPAIEAAEAARREGGVAASDIAHITVTGNAALAASCHMDRPIARADALWSVRHAVAAAFLEPKVAIASFGEDRIGDPAWEALRQKIELVTRRDWPSRMLTSSIRVAVRRRQGDVIEEVIGAAGMPPRYLTRDDVLSKARAAIGDVLPAARTEEVIDLVGRLDEAADSRGLATLLAAP